MKKVLMVILIICLVAFLGGCFSSKGDTKKNDDIQKKDNSKLVSLKNSIDNILLEKEITYEQAVSLNAQYKEILGDYNNTNAILKYIELKNMFKNSGDETLSQYSDFVIFEKNLFFMLIKYSIDNGSFIDKKSVIVSSLDKLRITGSVYNSETEKFVQENIPVFNNNNYSNASFINFMSVTVNAKNSFGGYTGNKYASFAVFTTSDTVYWVML